jgi:hypothetical protein
VPLPSAILKWLVLGHSSNETFWVEVTNELVTKFWRLEELCSQLKGPGARICDLLLGPLPSQARWADHLDEATRWLEVELATRCQVDTELEALRTSTALVQDLMLGNVNGSSSLAASLSLVAELLEGRIDTMVINGVRWETRSALVATLSHFLELKSELELLGSGQNVDLIDDQADGLWPLVSATSDSLASLVTFSFARYPPYDVGE